MLPAVGGFEHGGAAAGQALCLRRGLKLLAVPQAVPWAALRLLAIRGGQWWSVLTLRQANAAGPLAQTVCRSRGPAVLGLREGGAGG